MVVDQDPQHGGTLSDLPAALPETLAARTPSGGAHFFFPHAAGLGNQSGNLPKGFDVRGEGGYVVVAPSRHPATGRAYEWANPGTPLAEVPAWLLGLLRADQRPATADATPTTAAQPGPPTDQHNAWALSALGDVCSELESAKTGGRNNALNVAALRLFRIADGGLLDTSDVSRRLTEAGQACGLDLDEIKQTLHSARRKADKEPPVTGPADLGLDVRRAGKAVTDPVEVAAEKIRVQRAAKQRVDAEEAATRIVVLPRTTLGRLLTEDRPPEPQMRIDRLHRVGHNTTVTARFKTGKTTFSANQLRALADGEDFLGRFPVTQPAGRIGFLNYELSEWDFVDWLDDIGIRQADRVAPLNLRGLPFSLAAERHQAELVAWCREMEVEVLYLDPHRRAFTGFGSENSNDDVNRFTEVLDQIKAEAGVQDLFLNVHTGRLQTEIGEERARGATALDDWADNRLVLTQGEDGERYCYAADGRTGPAVAEFRLLFDHASRRLTAESGNRRDGLSELHQKDILNALDAAAEAGAAVGELEIRLDVKKKGALSASLKGLVADGRVIQHQKGNSKRNWLPQFAPKEGQ